MTGMVKLSGLVERTSKHGTRYLVGMLGDVKVVVCENRERQDDSEPSHCIYLAPVTQQAAPAPQPAPQPPKPAPRKAAPKRTVPKRDAQAAIRTHPAFNGDWQRPIAKGPGDPGWDGIEDRELGI
jgi:hypothetical protein